MNQSTLSGILRKHNLWLKGETLGKRANFRDADLYGADLCGANLRGANLSGADLCRADLRYANLCGANLCGANLCGANLCGANLRGADLRGADLCGADLRGADLRGAGLRGANLYLANLSGAYLTDVIVDETTKWFNLRCPAEGSYIGYKKCRGDLIVELKIPADAKRSSATSEKCRASKAKVISITNLDGSSTDVKEAVSLYNLYFVYRIGETVEVPDFDESRWNECSTGIHHFMTR